MRLHFRNTIFTDHLREIASVQRWFGINFSAVTAAKDYGKTLKVTKISSVSGKKIIKLIIKFEKEYGQV